MELFVKFKYVALMKIRPGNLALHAQNSDKNLLIYVLRTKSEYKMEVLSIHLQFKKTVARDLQLH